MTQTNNLNRNHQDHKNKLYHTIIIGSGISGLLVLKELKERGIQNVLILDKNPHPFGIWNVKNQLSVTKNTYSISPKLYMTITDFPMKKTVPSYPHHSDILNYYHDYAIHFKLLNHIRNNQAVSEASKQNGKWNVQTSDGNEFWAYNLVVANGSVNSDCLNGSQFDQLGEFSGQLYKSKNLTSNQQNKLQNKLMELSGKKILIIEMDNIGMKLAKTLKNNNTVFVSSQSIQTENRAKQASELFYSRYFDFIIKHITGKKILYKFFSKTFMKFMWGSNGNNGINAWKPNHDNLSGYHVKNKTLIKSLSKNAFKLKPSVKKINGSQILFKDNSLEKIDCILDCSEDDNEKTNKCFSFLKMTTNSTTRDLSKNLYKHIFSPYDQTLYFCGFIRPYLTSVPMLAELQARWIGQEIHSGNKGLPSKITMLKEIQKDRKKDQKEFGDHNQVLVNPYNYSGMVASKIKAVPSWIKLFFTNFQIFFVSLFFSWNHHFYRLNDTSKQKQKLAMDNIMENSKNCSSIGIMCFSQFMYVITLILIVLVVILVLSLNKYYFKWWK